jgi:hypothetical protein
VSTCIVKGTLCGAGAHRVELARVYAVWHGG